jgi:hypothetical protein
MAILRERRVAIRNVVKVAAYPPMTRGALNASRKLEAPIL